MVAALTTGDGAIAVAAISHADGPHRELAAFLDQFGKDARCSGQRELVASTQFGGWAFLAWAVRLTGAGTVRVGPVRTAAAYPRPTHVAWARPGNRPEGRGWGGGFGLPASIAASAWMIGAARSWYSRCIMSGLTHHSALHFTSPGVTRMSRSTIRPNESTSSSRGFQPAYVWHWSAMPDFPADFPADLRGPRPSPCVGLGIVQIAQGGRIRSRLASPGLFGQRCAATTIPSF